MPAVAATSSKITVMVNNNADVEPALLRSAEAAVARVFRAASIEIAWINCQEVDAATVPRCRSAPGPSQFMLQIVPTGKTSRDSVFGLSFLGENGRGKYCDVFFNRIEYAHRQFGADTAQLLGAVAAHELGHLLLGSNAHSRSGIMKGVWRSDVLHEISFGNLWFTDGQSLQMRARIESESTPSSFVAVSTRARNF
jgi:hypothetical protein